jgi:hypothetical protein
MNLQYNSETNIGLNVQEISSSTTTAGNVIDTKGFKDAKVIVVMGARTDGTLTPLIQESDTSGSGYTDVSDDFLLGTEAGAAVSAANTADTVGVVLTKRYLKVSGVSSAVTSGFTGGIIVELGSPTHAPVA